MATAGRVPKTGTMASAGVCDQSEMVRLNYISNLCTVKPLWRQSALMEDGSQRLRGGLSCVGGVRESNESYEDHKLSCVCTNLLQELLKSEKDMTVIVILGSSSTLSSMSS